MAISKERRRPNDRETGLVSVLVRSSGRDLLVYCGVLLVAVTVGVTVAYSQSFLGDKGPYLLAGALLGVAIAGAILLQWRLGALLLVAVLPYESVITFGPVASGNKVIALLTFASLALALMRDQVLFERFLRLWQQPLALAVLAFVLWVSASILWASDQNATSGRIITFLGVFGLMVVVALLEKRYLALTWLVAVLGTALSVPAGYVLPQSGKMEAVGRFGTGGADPNSYACLLTIVFFVAYFGLLSRHKTSAYLLVPVFLYGIFATQSRTGLLVLVATPVLAAFIPWVAARLGRRTLFMYAVGAAALAVIVLAIPSVGEGMMERYSGLSQIEDADSWSGRWSIWQAAFQIIAGHPFLGVGAGNFAEFAIYYSTHIAEHSAKAGEVAGVAHNMLLGVASELGLVGLTFFLGILFFAFKSAVPLSQESDLGIGLLLGLIAFVIAGMTLTWEYDKIGYVLFASVLALRLHNSAPRARVPAGQKESH
jgi:O-antigen ligase